MEKTRNVIVDTELFCAHNYKPIPVVLVKGSGVWVWDIEGVKYMDMLSCYSAVNAGHSHSAILKVLFKQAETLAQCSRAYYTDKLDKFAKILCEITGMEAVLPMNTGAEGVETAIKIARKWGYTKKLVEKNKAEIIVCKGNFHGRTTTVISFSSEEQYKDGFGPLTPGFVPINFGNIKELEVAINKNTVAFLVEPIQGEAGIIVPKDGFLREARKICSENNVLFIADEIQTGLARTGKIFACQHENIVPDMYILGKALGGGFMPVSAVVSRWDIMDVMKPGDHGSTFGGGPLGCAVAEAYLNLMVNENFAELARIRGNYFKEKLLNIRSSLIKEVRGRGLLIGVELKEKARLFCEELMKEGVLSKETHDYVIRFAPPLIITNEEIDWAIERIKRVLAG